jgi:hypothetical protein
LRHTERQWRINNRHSTDKEIEREKEEEEKVVVVVVEEEEEEERRFTEGG